MKQSKVTPHLTGSIMSSFWARVLLPAFTALMIGVAAVAATAPPATNGSNQHGRGPELISQLQVAPEAATAAFDRDSFGYRRNKDQQGCDTRQKVLVRQSATKVTIGPDCKLGEGDWLSPYDLATFTDPGDLTIDHMVPLAEAWRSGAAGWDAARKKAFANDLEHRAALIAVSRSSNSRKQDKDPAGYKPGNVAYWCQYATDWIEVKVIWGLTADEAEVRALSEMLGTC